MKKTLIVLLVLLFTFSTVVVGSAQSNAEAASVFGDVNSDTEVDAKDYMMVKRHVLQTYTLSAAEMSMADLNGDGDVTARDYMVLKLIVLGRYEPQQPERNPYSDLTDEELYAEIDRLLSVEREPGEVMIRFLESVASDQALAIFDALAITELFQAEPRFLDGGERLMCTVTVEEEDVREVMFALARHEAVYSVSGNEILYPDEV